jgi:hypothetical protein
MRISGFGKFLRFMFQEISNEFPVINILETNHENGSEKTEKVSIFLNACEYHSIFFVLLSP